MSIGNRITMILLRSPLHRVVSGSLMVLEYRGRRSGKTFRLPLQYVPAGTTLVVWAGNGAAKTWWRNFEQPTRVTVVLRGKERPGTAHLMQDVEEKAQALKSYLARYPYTSESGRPRFLGSRWQPTPNELRQAADAAVLVAFELDA